MVTLIFFQLNFWIITTGMYLLAYHLYIRPFWQLLLTTTDGGNHWTSDTCKLTAMIYGGIFPLNKEKILGVGDHVFKSSNTGKPGQT
jgi:hypothetical protein